MHTAKICSLSNIGLFFFLLFFCIFVFFFLCRPSEANLRPTCSYRASLLAPQQGMTCPCRLERCRIWTRDCRFYSLVHYHRATTSLSLSHHIPNPNIGLYLHRVLILDLHGKNPNLLKKKKLSEKIVLWKKQFFSKMVWKQFCFVSEFKFSKIVIKFC